MRNSKTTMKDIAEKLGLSVSTVNRALLGKGRISNKTKQSIQEVAREMGYSTNVFAKTLSAKESIKIGIICPYDIFFKDVIQGVNTYYNEIANYKIELIYKNSEVYGISEQLRQIEECIAQEVDGILLAPAHPLLLNNAIDKLSSLGISVVTFNNDAPDSARLCFVGENGEVAGATAAEIMSKMLPSGSRVAVVASLSSPLGIRDRTQSFMKSIRESGKGYTLVGPFEYQDIPESSYEIVSQVIQTQQADAIYANNMEGTRAIGRVLSKMQPEKHIIAIGHDSNEEINRFIKSSIIDVTLFQDPFAQGYYALKLLFEEVYLKRSINRQIFYIQTVPLFKANLEQKSMLYL